MTPQRSMTSRLSACNVSGSGSGCFSSRDTRIHMSPLRVVTLTPPAWSCLSAAARRPSALGKVSGDVEHALGVIEPAAAHDGHAPVCAFSARTKRHRLVQIGLGRRRRVSLTATATATATAMKRADARTRHDRNDLWARRTRLGSQRVGRGPARRAGGREHVFFLSVGRPRRRAKEVVGSQPNGQESVMGTGMTLLN